MNFPTLGCTNNIGICIASVIFICLIYAFIIPFMIISTYKFYRIKHYGGISARYPTIIIASSIYNILHIFIIDQYMLISNGISPQILQSANIRWLTHIIFPPFLFIIPIITFLRIWLIDFDIKHALQKSTRDWQILLASTVEHDDWYSLNKRKYGNWKWLLKICIIAWCFLSVCIIIPTMLLSSKSVHVSQSMYVILLILLLIPIAFVWYKTPYFEDSFYIKKEMQILLKCDIICVVLWFSLSFWAVPQNIFDLIQHISVIMVHFIQVYVSVHWVIVKQRELNRHKPMLARNSMNKINNNRSRFIYNLCDFMNFGRIDAEFERSSNSFRRSIVNGRMRSKSFQQRLLTNQRLFNVLVATDIGINCLFDHLKREFCFESLLFFIEIVQWIYSVTDKSLDKFDINPLSDIQFEFAAIIPISSINNTDHDWFYKLDQIYNKYIGPFGEYQVNLPWNVTNEYYNLLRLFAIKQQIESGTYAPKMKRKTHHKKTKTFWSRAILSKKKENSKELPSIKYEKSHEISDDDDLEEEERKMPNTRNIPIPITQSFNTIHEHKTLTPTDHKTTATVDLGTIRYGAYKMNSNKEDAGCLVLEQKPNRSDGDIQPRRHPLKLHKSSTLIEKDSVIVDTDSEDEDDRVMDIDDDIEDTQQISLKSWKDPSIEDSNDASIEENDDTVFKLAEITTHDWDTSEIVLIEEEEEAETPIPMETTLMTRNTSEDSHHLEDIYEDVLGGALSMEYDKSVSKTITYQSHAGKEPNVTITDKNISKTSTEVQLNDIFEQVLGAESVVAIEVDRGSMDSVVSKKRVKLSVDVVPDEKKEENKLMIPGGYSLSQQRSVSKGNVLSKLSSLIPIAFSPSIRDNMETDADDDEEDEIDEAEQKQMEEANRVTVHDFVSVSCRAIYEILKLNYHSVARFKRSVHFKTFEESVNLDELLKQFGDKGC